jgi:uncharacterized protein
MKTVVLGASTNPARYSYMASDLLTEYGHEIVPVGLKHGSIFGKEILDVRIQPDVPDVDTVTVYVGPANQAALFEYIPRLKPRRVIFNPGAENQALEKSLNDKGIATLQACTLVMLRSGQY